MISISGPGGDARRDRGALIRELLVNLPAAVGYVAGDDLVFEFANTQYQEIFGGRPLLGLPLREALPDLPADRLDALLRVVRTGQPHQARESELWVRAPGRPPVQRFMDFVYQPVHGDDGNLEGVLFYGNDVTSHVRDRLDLEELTAELASSEERYRTLFETLPLGVIHFNADGSILGANPAAASILGLTPVDLAGRPLDWADQAVHDDGRPYALDEIPVMVALRSGKIVTDVPVGVPQGNGGELRWLRVTAVPDARDAQGRPQRAYAMLADVTEQRRAETVLRESNRLLGRLREANVLGVVVESEEGIQEANDAYLDIIGYDRDDMTAGEVPWSSVTPREWAEADEDALGQLRRTGVCEPYEKEQLHRDGHRVPILVGGAVMDRKPLRWVMFVVDLSARQRAEQERAALLAGEQAARAEATAAWERLSFLMRAGNLVAATRDPDVLLEQVTQLVVPQLADYCVAFMPVRAGELRATKLTHRDPAGAEALRRLLGHPIPTDGPLISQVAYTTATTQLATDFSAVNPAWAAEAPHVMAIVEQVHPTSAVAVPLLADDRHPLGVLVLGRGEERPRFADTDAAVLEELGRRLASGLATVEAFAREHTVAETLQRALLPNLPPSIAGLDLAVRYLPATDGVHVGGDWYDAFPIDDQRVGLAIGDVVGHSIDSASDMGQVRSLLHGYAIDNPAPPDVLRRTNIAISQMLPETLATVWYGVLDRSTGDLVHANAGHPPALVTGGRGHAAYLRSPRATMLGVSPTTTFTAAHRHLLPRERLLLYTDGLIEVRSQDISQGLAALREALARSPGRTAEEACQSAQTAMIGSASRADDVCILVVGRTSARPRRTRGLARKDLPP